MFISGDEKIAIVTDTSCDLSQEQLEEYGISTVSLRIATSKGEFRDRLELGQEELYQLLETELPKTSLPLPEDVSDVYSRLFAEGATRILHISISSGLSGTYNMVKIVSEDFPDKKIDVYDSKTLSCGLGLLVLTAAETLSQGKTVEDAIAAMDEARKNQLGMFVIRTLEFLRKGGRIGKVEGVVGSLLQIKPVIFVDENGVYQTKVKARGFQNAVKAMCDELVLTYAGRKVRLAVVNGKAPEEAEKVLSLLKQKLNVVSSFISTVSPALAIHTGPGLVGAIVQPVE